MALIFRMRVLSDSPMALVGAVTTALRKPQRGFLLVAATCGFSQPVVLGMGADAASVRGGQRGVLVDADIIDRLAKIAGDVDPFAADFPVGIWDPFQEGVGGCLPHKVHESTR